MIDIVSWETGKDLGVLDTSTPRAANILSVQVGDLEYAQELGIDLKYFLSEDFQFQNASFKAYCVQVLANNGINVATVLETVETFQNRMTFNISPEQNTTSLVR